MKEKGEDEIGEDISEIGGVEIHIAVIWVQIFNSSVLDHKDDGSNKKKEKRNKSD